MSAPKIEIYTWSSCPFCIRAKALLDSKGVSYTEYEISGNEAAREEMSLRANGQRTLPQIFIDDVWIGGCDDLYIKEADGSLSKILAA